MVYRALPRYGAPYELTRLMNVLTPQLVFLEVGPSPEAVEAAREIRAVSPKTPVIGFGCDCEPDQLRELEKAGVSNLLFWPFTAGKFKSAVIRAIDQERIDSSSKVVAFLPAKAGSGSSTAALNVAGALARAHNQEVLIIDADMHSGVQALLLGCSSEKSIADALENARALDDAMWGTLALRARGLTLLAAPGCGGVTRLFSPWDYLHLLGFARSRYDCVVIDLPEVVNDATEAVVKQAEEIYVVCTPELASLTLARRRIVELQTRGAEDDRVAVVLNRHSNRGLKLHEVEEVVGRKVALALPNDYPRVCKAGLKAGLLEGESKIARAFADFAHLVATHPDKPSRTVETKAPNLAAAWCPSAV